MRSKWILIVFSEDNENNRGQKNPFLGEAGPKHETKAIMRKITAGFARHGALWVKFLLY